MAPKKAWKSSETRTNSQASTIQDQDTVYEYHQRQNIPNLLTSRSLNSATNPDSEASLLSAKHENITNEWGFKDHRTAMLMLQRAEKMKYKVERKNRLKALDPKQRLKLLRKLDKYTPRETTPQYTPKNLVNPVNVEVAPDLASQTPNNRTYEWVHAQVRDLPTTPLFKLNDIVTTKVPKLPQISNGNSNNIQWRNGSISSNSSTPALKPPPPPPPPSSLPQSQQGSKLLFNTSTNLLPPLSTLKLNYDVINQSADQDQFSLHSSRSSFTNMFLNSKKIKNNDLGNKRKKKK